VAEETDLILDIGKWVLNEGCAQISAWQRHDHTRGLVLALNVSAIQFFQADFVDQVQAAIQRHAIDPRLLKLELTESALLENIEDTVAAMAVLRRQGVQFSLDDFGSGYSSLQYLKRLPIDQLKIDQSFIRDIVHDANCAAIVRTIIAIAQSLSLGVIAEGVETEAQWRLLLDHGCTHCQGDLFGKPLPLPHFESLLAGQRRVGDLAHQAASQS
jgi:EAL domain-containing protein (putative c-di-GMP-specific phosphodiesterase class I)